MSETQDLRKIFHQVSLISSHESLYFLLFALSILLTVLFVNGMLAGLLVTICVAKSVAIFSTNDFN